MPYLAVTNTYPGYWGRGDTETEAIHNCRASGGRGKELVLLEIDPFYKDPYVDQMGYVGATVWDEALAEATERDEWPPVVMQKWRLGTRGKRTLITE